MSINDLERYKRYERCFLVKVVKIDFSNHQQLVDALRGNDVVLLTFGDLPNLERNSKAIIDAAIEAGVKRVIPSEFGVDTHSPTGRRQIVFDSKVKIDDYLEEKSNEGTIEFTSIYTGLFFDWRTQESQMFLGFDMENKRATIYNGGTTPLNLTTLEALGASVVSVLSTPKKFKNRRLRICDLYASQRDILALLEAETGIKFVVEEMDANVLQDEGEAGLRKGDLSLSNVFGAILGATFATNASRWSPDDDTASLGLAKQDLKAQVLKVLLP